MLKRMANGILVGAAALLVVGAASAQTPPTARQLELAQRYVAAMQMEKTVGATTDALLPAMMGTGVDKLPEARRAEFMAIMRETTRDMVLALSARMAPILAETFTEKELEDVVAFYEGSSGRAFVEKAPLLTAKMAPIMRELAPQMQQQLLERLCKDGGCPPGAQAK